MSRSTEPEAAPGYRRPGARALLFDRLCSRGWDGDPTTRRPPPQTYGADELQASVFEQLGWLLNTRSPIDYPTLEARNRAGRRSTIDYGIPDLSNYILDDTSTMLRLSDHLAQTVARFEPRLRDVAVELGRADHRNQRLAVTIAGNIVTDMIVIPIRFSLEIGDGERGPDAG